jgi:hypothetical protein
MRKLSSMLWFPGGARAVLFLLRNHSQHNVPTTSVTLPFAVISTADDGWEPPPAQDPWERPAWDHDTMYIVPVAYLEREDART